MLYNLTYISLNTKLKILGLEKFPPRILADVNLVILKIINLRYYDTLIP